jgi:WD40 repeat protein
MAAGIAAPTSEAATIEHVPAEEPARAEAAGTLTGMPPPGPHTAPEPAALPDYELLGELGRGGMGVVYQARHRQLHRVVALKMILAGEHADPRDAARFRTEAAAIARLQHPNIVQIHDIGDHRGLPYLALEFVAGGSLANRLDGTPWPPQRAAELVETLARAVHVAHQAGVVHRDLKPANVLLTPDGTPKLTDFGLAKFMDADAGPTQTGVLVGTPSYMAPEQAAGKAGAVGPATDVYALGAILYELLTGRPPFRADTPLATALAVVYDEPVPPRRLQPKVPRDLETVCLQCLHKDAARRYSSALALADDLRRFRSGELIHARTAPVWERAWYRARRHPVVATLVVVVLLLGLLFGELFGPAAYRQVMDQGQLVLEADAPGVSVVVKHDGNPVAVLDPDVSPEVTLPSGTYQLELSRAPQGLTLSAAEVTVRRGGRKAVEILRTQVLTEARFFVGHQGPVRSVAFSPDAQLILSGSGWPQGDWTMRLWDAATATQLHVFRGHKGNVLSVAFSPDGKSALSGSADGTVRLWDVQEKKERRSFVGHAKDVQCVAFAPDGRHFLSGGLDHSLRLWSVDSGTVVRQFKGHKAGVSGVAFAPDGPRAVSCSNQGTAVRVWDVASGREILRFEGHTVPGVYSVAFSPNGTYIVSGGNDRVVRLWDAITGQEERRFEGHTGVISSVAFSPDGKQVLSGSWDKTARLWDVASGRELCRFEGYREEIWSVAVAPDGRHGLCGGGGDLRDDRYRRGRDWGLRLWELPQD